MTVTPEEFEKYLVDAETSPLGTFGSTCMQEYVAKGNNSEDLNNPSDFEKTLGRPLEPFVDIVKEYISS